MLRILIEKEIRDLTGSTKFVITFGVCALLIIAAFYVGAVRHKLSLAQYDASRTEQTRALEGVTDWMDVNDVRVFLPPEPLAALVSGVSNDIERTAVISGRGDIPTEDSRFNEDPIYAIFRFIDLEFTFAVILSLFAILLGYDAISGEKERGTLRLTFANAVPKRTYIMAKLLGSYLTLTTSIIIAILVGVFLFLILGMSLSAMEWLRLFLIVLAGLLFFGVFLSLSIFVSALTHRSSSSFLILLVIWVMFVHIVPRASVLLAARSVDVPSVDEIAYQKSSLAIQLGEEFREGMRNIEIPATSNPNEDPMMKFNEYMDSLTNIRESKLNALSSRLREERNNLQRVQESLAFTLARLSPVTLFSLATSYLAGTSIYLKDKFYDEALAYQAEYGRFIKEKTGLNPGGMLKVRASKSCSGGGEEDEQPKQIDATELPAFTFSNDDFKSSFESAVVDLGLLGILNLFLFAGSFLAFVRYDVR